MLSFLHKEYHRKQITKKCKNIFLISKSIDPERPLDEKYLSRIAHRNKSKWFTYVQILIFYQDG